MKSKTKYAIIGLVLGGFLPALFHPPEITVFATVEDVIIHIIGGLVGTLAGLGIYKINKSSGKVN